MELRSRIRSQGAVIAFSERKALLAQAFEVSPAPQLITGDRRIVDCNDAFGRLFGHQPASLVGRSVLVLYPSRVDYSRVGERALAWLQHHDSYADERFMRHADGEIFWARARGVTLTPGQPFRLAVWSFERIEQPLRRASDLTPREREISVCIVNGHTSKETAALLGISHRTVEVHRARLMQKLQARNAADLVSRIVEIRRQER